MFLARQEFATVDLCQRLVHNGFRPGQVIVLDRRFGNAIIKYLIVRVVGAHLRRNHDLRR